MLKIYLADLVYDTVKTNYVVPLNVAYIAAYVEEKHAKDVDVKIFKYPHELEKFIKDAPPDILGLSNYSWNERLNQTFLKLACNPPVKSGHAKLEVFGQTMLPRRPKCARAGLVKVRSSGY